MVILELFECMDGNSRPVGDFGIYGLTAAARIVVTLSSPSDVEMFCNCWAQWCESGAISCIHCTMPEKVPGLQSNGQTRLPGCLIPNITSLWSLPYSFEYHRKLQNKLIKCSELDVKISLLSFYLDELYLPSGRSSMFIPTYLRHGYSNLWFKLPELIFHIFCSFIINFLYKNIPFFSSTESINTDKGSIRTTFD